MNNPIPRGQVSTILLSCLLSGDKYGAELLNDLHEQSGSQVVIKQPTLYNTLARMEKQGYISSYWRDSKIGGKRHYYSLTDLGKKLITEKDNVIYADNVKNEAQKYDEIGGFQKKDDQVLVSIKSERENLHYVDNQKSDSAPVEDDGVFLGQNEVYIIPDLKRPAEDEKKYDEIQDFEEKDRGVFITEKLDADQIPKVRKLAGVVNLDIQPRDELAQKIRANEATTYNDKIQELYGRMNSGGADFYQNEQPLAELETTADLQERYDDMQIKFYANSVSTENVQTEYGKIPTRQLFAKYFTIFCFSAVVAALIFFLYNNSGVVPLYSWAYIVAPALLLVPAGRYLFSKEKFRNIHPRNASIWLGIGIFLVGTAACFSLNLLFGDITLATVFNFPTTFVLPSALLFGFVIGGVFDVAFTKKWCAND